MTQAELIQFPGYEAGIMQAETEMENSSGKALVDMPGSD
jgi:hypothetical protein